MRRLFVALLALLLFLPVATSWSIAKAGSKCSKLGKKEVLKNFEYTCIKKNGKLVWSKGSKIGLAAPITKVSPSSTPNPIPGPTPTSMQSPIATPTPTSMQSPIATPTPLTDEQKWDATGSNALNVYRKWANKKLDEAPRTKIDYQFSQNFWPEVAVSFKKRFDSVAAYYDRFTNIQIPVYFSAGTYEDIDWACKLLETRDPTRKYQNCLDDQKNDISSYYHVSRGYDLQNGSANFYLIKMREVEQGIDFQVRIEHEYFHTVQQNILGNRFRTTLPCWFLEGGAEYFGMLTFSQGDVTKFLQFRQFKIFEMPQQRPSDVSAEDFSKWLFAASVPWQSSLQSWVDQCSPYRNNGMYHDAVLAVEWLVDRIGVDGVIALLENAKNSSWNDAFQKQSGITYSEGVRLMGEYMLKERNIAMKNSWIRPERCIAREPGPVRQPPGCWFW